MFTHMYQESMFPFMLNNFQLPINFDLKLHMKMSTRFKLLRVAIFALRSNGDDKFMALIYYYNLISPFSSKIGSP